MPPSTFTFNDPTSFRAAIRAQQVDGMVTGRGRFQAELVRVDFERLLMQHAAEALPRVFHVQATPQRIAIIFATDPGLPEAYVSGLPLRSDEIIAWDTRLPNHHKSAGACRWGSVSLSIDDLLIYSESMVGQGLSASADPVRIKPSAPVMAELQTLHRTARDLAKNSPELLHHSEVRRALEQRLVQVMISSLFIGESVVASNADRQHAKVMRRFEQVLEEDPGKPLYMTEICTAVGASYASLRACCQEHLGMSPKRYLWLRRMHLARQALDNADPETQTVTECATACGFWELGRFSVAYRSLFGEAPSVTLRRSAGERRGEKMTDSPWKFIESA